MIIHILRDDSEFLGANRLQLQRLDAMFESEADMAAVVTNPLDDLERDGGDMRFEDARAEKDVRARSR